MARLASRLQNPPTFIDHQCGRFLIMDAPTDANLSLYLEEARRLGVGKWVRCCEGCSYDPAKVAGAGISEHDLSFPDGEAPPLPLISRWLDLCFADEATVAVHCVAGLGRALRPAISRPAPAPSPTSHPAACCAAGARRCWLRLRLSRRRLSRCARLQPPPARLPPAHRRCRCRPPPSARAPVPRDRASSNRERPRARQAGVDAGDAVDFIRKRRRGAINKVQLKYVLEYKPTRRKDKCVLM